MSSYATITDVEARVPARAPFGTTTKPTASQVSLLLAEAHDKVDAALTEGGYDVPISGNGASVALGLVKAATCDVCAALIEVVAPSGRKESLDTYMRMRDAALKMLCEGQLPGVSRSSTDAQPRFSDPGASRFVFDVDMQL